MATGKYRKTTPEERARWRENEERMARILDIMDTPEARARVAARVLELARSLYSRD